MAALVYLSSTSSTSAPPAFQPYVPAAQATRPPPAQSGPSTSAQFVTKEKLDEKVLFKKPKNAGTIQPSRSPYPPYHDTVPYPPGYQIPPFSIFDGEVALKDTYLISLPLVGTLPQNGSLPLRQFPLSLDGPAYEWYDNLRPGSNIKLETDAKGLGKHSGQRIGLRKQIKLKCLPS